MPDPSAGMTHPDDHVTASYLDGSLPATARDLYEAHLSACDGCRAGVALLAAPSLSGAGPNAETVPAEFIARARRAGRTFWTMPAGRGGRALGGRRGLLAAAALLAGFVALAALMLVLSPRDERPDGRPVYRGEATSPFGELRPSAGSVAPVDDLVFFWSPVPGADRYVVSVMNASGETLAAIEAPGTASSVAWPSALEPPGGGRYSWRIKALKLDRLVAESRPIPFEVR